MGHVFFTDELGRDESMRGVSPVAVVVFVKLACYTARKQRDWLTRTEAEEVCRTNELRPSALAELFEKRSASPWPAPLTDIDGAIYFSWRLVQFPTARRKPPGVQRLITAGRREWGKRRKVLAPLILRRDGAYCRTCGRSDKLQIDHIFPIARGGTSEPTNLQVLCRSCNVRKGAR